MLPTVILGSVEQRSEPYDPATVSRIADLVLQKIGTEQHLLTYQLPASFKLCAYFRI